MSHVPGTGGTSQTPEPRRRDARPMARAVVVVAVLVLGVMAALRMPVAHLPADSFPELSVRLDLAPSPGGTDSGRGAGGALEETQRRWILPIESAIRSVGSVTSVAGDVGPAGAQLRVRLAPGADAERKAARLESELTEVRRQLEDEDAGRLTVMPVGPGGGRSLVVWLGEDGERSHAALVESIRDLPSVRDLDIAGAPDRSLRWTLGSGGGDLSALADRLFAAESQPVGAWTRGGRRWPVVVADNEALPAERWVGERPVRVESVADSALGHRDPTYLARVDGRPGVMLQIFRLDGVSPLALESEVRELLGDEMKILWSEAEPVRRLLRGLARGALAALLLSSLVAGLLLGRVAALWQAAAVPLAAAAGLNALWILDLSLDLTTAVGLVLGLGAALAVRAVLPASVEERPGPVMTGPVTTGLVMTALVAAWLLPLVIRVLGRDLGALLSAPVLAFAVSTSAAVPALLLLPRPPGWDRPWGRRVARFVLRRPWAVVLAAVLVSFVAFGLLGDRLVPRSGELLSRSADLAIRLDFPRGTDLAEATARVAAAEAHLLDRRATESLWTFFDRSGARLSLTLDAAERADARHWARIWRRELAGLGAAVRVEAFGDGERSEPLRFGTSLAARAEADLASYSFVLRSTDSQRLLTARRLIQDRLTSSSLWKLGNDHLETRWTEPSPRLELRPRESASPAEVEAAVAGLSSRLEVIDGRSVTLPGSAGRPVWVEVAGPGAPKADVDADDATPQLADVMAGTGGGSVAPARVLRLREGVGSPTLRREDGRFVLPVTVSFQGFARGQVLDLRAWIHRRMAETPVSGVDVERPRLGLGFWTEERLLLLGIAGALPLLFLALAMIRLDSLALGLATWAPGVLALAFSAVYLAFVGADLDELSLLALAGALAATLPLVLETAAALRFAAPGRLAGAAGYRWLVRRLPSVAVAAVGWTALLWGATWGEGWAGDAATESWVGPLQTAAVAGLGVILGSFLVLPGLLRAVDRLRFHDAEEAARRARPPAWRATAATDAPTLEVRRLTKTWADQESGEAVRALDRVSFRLEPGIVGLLGPNGAGKTTLLRHLCGLLRANRGQVLFRGVPLVPENLAEYRRQVGFLPQEFNAYEGFTAESFLDFWAIERGLRDRAERRREVERLLRLVGLEDAADRRVRDFSGGMRRRIGIARSLLGSPPILLVDEPTTGLDVESRHRLRESLLAAASERIILFSTHIASDVAAAASRILLLHRGRLLFDGPSGELIDEAVGRVFETLVDDAELRDFSSRYRVTTRVRTLDGLRVRAVAARNQEPAGEIVRPNLEEAYLAKLGETAQNRPSRVESLLDLGV